MQKAVVTIGTTLIEMKEVKYTPSFRYVMIRNDFLKDIHHF